MPLTNPRRLTGYSEAQYGREAPYSDALDAADHSGEDYDDEEEEDEEEVDQDDDASSITSELSIPDANIDFSLVYALHTFVATVEGQASVVKGDALTLLDDSNSYWWLIKVLKTSEVGYIPAENIETPYERLARLNSHRNAELTWQENDQEIVVNAKKGSNSKQKKRVTMSRGVMFQAQLILSTSDDEDLEEEYEEWQEDMRSETDSDFDSDEDIYEIDGSDQMHHHSYQVGPYPRQVHSDLVIKNQDYTPDTQPAVSGPAPSQMMEPETLQNVAKQTPVVTDVSENTKTTAAAADLDNRRASPYKPGLDLDQDETIKISLTPSIARDDQYGSGNSDEPQNRQRKSNKLEKLIHNSEEGQRLEEQKDGGRDDTKEKKGGFKRFFSRGKDSKDKKKKASSSYGDARRSSDTETSSINSQSTGYSDHRKNSVDSSAQDHQPTPLRIYAGNIQFATPYKTINVYPSTTAAELVERAVDTFDIHDTEDLVDGHLDFYICIKGVDGDEYTLIPQDKPLMIFNTLTAHLNTPMPSLKKARRISQLMSMGEPNMGNHAHVGGPKVGNGGDNVSEIKLYLNHKVKRVDERDGKIHIKVLLVTNKQQQLREAKIMAVAPHALTGDIIMHALERFKISNAYAFDFGDDDEVYDLGRRDVPYTLSISVQDQVTKIPAKHKILSAFRGSISEFYQKRNSSNPDRSSTTSNIAAPSGDETFFILQPHYAEQNTPKQHMPEQVTSTHKNQDHHHHHHHHDPRHQLVRQNTPAMLDVSRSKMDNNAPPQAQANDQRTRLLESLAITEDISDDSDREEQDHRLTESPTPVEAKKVDISPPTQTQKAIEEQPESPSSQDDDIMSQLNKVLDDFGRSDYQSPPLTSPLPDERSMSSFSQASDYSQESYREEEKHQSSQKAASSQPNNKVSRSASTVRKAHQSMMLSDNFGLEALMTLVRGDADYANALEQNKGNSDKNDRDLVNRKSLEEIRIQISKELYGDQLTQLDMMDKTLDQIMANAIRLFP